MTDFESGLIIAGVFFAVAGILSRLTYVYGRHEPVPCHVVATELVLNFMGIRLYGFIVRHDGTRRGAVNLSMNPYRFPTDGVVMAALLGPMQCGRTLIMSDCNGDVKTLMPCHFLALAGAVFFLTGLSAHLFF